MIKVVLVRLDGTPGDEFRLAATDSLARLFDAHIAWNDGAVVVRGQMLYAT